MPKPYLIDKKLNNRQVWIANLIKNFGCVLSSNYLIQINKKKQSINN